MSNEPIEDKLDNLSVAYNSLTKLGIIFGDLKNDKDAFQVETRTKELRQLIDKLAEKSLNQWCDGADKIIDEINIMNSNLGQCLSEIDKKMKLAENCIKAIDIADQIVKKIKNELV